jgi:large subunit ribosomal protein L10
MLMALTKEQKNSIVSAVHAKASDGALSLVAATYTGVSVSQMTELRKLAREQGVFVMVIKNTLARKSFVGTDFEAAAEHMKGPLVYFLGYDAPGVAARLVRDFSKKHDSFKVQFVTVGSSIYTSEQIDAVAELPTKDEAISMLMSCMQAPVSKFVRTLAEPAASFVRTVSAVGDTKK